MNIVTTIEDHIRDFRLGIGDSQFEVNYIITYMNRALNELEQENKIIGNQTELVTFSSEAQKSKYELPLCVTTRIKSVRYDGEPLRKLSRASWNMYDEAERYRTGEPTHYVVHDGHIILHPIPEDDANTYTIEENMAHDDEELTLNSLTDLPEQGTLYIPEDGSATEEIVRYSGLDSTNTKVLNVEREQEGTLLSIIAHQADTIITHRNIEVEVVGSLKRVIPAPEKMGNLSKYGSGDGPTEGIHQIWVSNYSTTWRVESPLSWLGEIEMEEDDGTIKISNEPISTDPYIDKYRVWMSKAGEIIPYYAHATVLGAIFNPDSDTNFLVISTSDSTLESIGIRYYNPCINIPRRYRSVVTHLALANYFEDHEQYTNAQARRSLAAHVLDNWLFNEDGEEDGFFMLGDYIE